MLIKKGLRGGVIYHDGQFDDSRMAITLALSANSKKTSLLNYCNVDGLLKKNNEIVGLSFTDSINSKKYQVKSKVVINATGVFAEEIIRMDQPKIEKMIQPSQGVHIVLEKKFLAPACLRKFFSQNTFSLQNTFKPKVSCT